MEDTKYITKTHQEMSKDELIELYKSLNNIVEEFEKNMQAIKTELASRMTTNSEVIGNFSVTKATRVSFKTKLEEAKELGAVIVEESVDTKKLKTLYEAGVTIPGVQETEYLTIKNIEKKGE